MDVFNKSLSELFSNSALNISLLCSDERFYEIGDDYIHSILKKSKVNNEQTKKLVEGLYKTYGTNCIKFLQDINFNFWDENDVEGANFGQIAKEIFEPLKELKILGLNIFQDLIDYYNSHSFRELKEEDGAFNIDWQHMYEEANTELSKIKEITSIDLSFRYDSLKHITEDLIDDSLNRYCADLEKLNYCKDLLKPEDEFDFYFDDENIYKEVIENAIRANDPSAVLSLAKNYVNRADGKKYRSLFKYACRISSIDSALVLLRLGGGINGSECEKLLYKAMSAGNIGFVNFLIARGASHDNSVLLKIAIRKNMIDFGKRLIEDGTHIDKESLELVISLNNIEYTQMLIEEGANVYDGFLYVVWGENGEIFNMLMKNGANVNALDKDNNTPLHNAAKRNEPKVAEQLIIRGAKIDAINSLYQTPLYLAAGSNSVEIAEMLIRKGANVDFEDRYHYSILHNAALRNSVDIARLLLNNGANIESTYNGETPLFYAISNESTETAILLIDSGADISFVNKEKQTLLHIAARNKNALIAKSLIEHGADIEAMDKYMKRPIHWAAWANASDVVNVLIEHGADIYARCCRNRSPLQVARKAKSPKVIEIFENLYSPMLSRGIC